MTSVPGLYAAGEASFSDHGANRLGASALMQGLADGYFVLPYTIGDYLASDIRLGAISADTPEFEGRERRSDRIDHLINNNGSMPVDDFHRRLGHHVERVRMSRGSRIEEGHCGHSRPAG